MRTARQGTLDGLCGLYAVINALDLVGVDPPRGSRLHRYLFKALAHGLGAVALLSGLQDGLDAGDLLNATALAFDGLKADYGVRLAVTRPFPPRRLRSVRRFVGEVQALAAQPETTVIVSYERPGYAHWTVVREVGAGRITLRYPGGVGALRLADFDPKRGFWRFRMADTLMIQRVGACMIDDMLSTPAYGEWRSAS